MPYSRSLPPDEAASQVLADLYEGCGFRRYKMSKFEEYSLYSDNKSFLQSEHILTFYDGGKLMALKPDVTLSIAKNADISDVRKQKLYYIENVYRERADEGEFSEIMQIGLESLGAIDLYRVCETVALAERSLELLGDYALVVSHMGILSSVLDGCTEAARCRIIRCFSSKASYDLPRLCEKYGVGEDAAGVLSALSGIGGQPEKTFEKARAILADYPDALTALDELQAVCSAVGGRLTVDFSALNDESYYNGIIMRGYLNGAPRAVLSGGRYDRLMERLGKTCGAIGFAVYLGELERYGKPAERCDADVLILYTEDTPAAKVLEAVGKYQAEGRRVRAERSAEGFEYGEIIRL